MMQSTSTSYHVLQLQWVVPALALARTNDTLGLPAHPGLARFRPMLVWHSSQLCPTLVSIRNSQMPKPRSNRHQPLFLGLTTCLLHFSSSPGSLSLCVFAIAIGVSLFPLHPCASDCTSVAETHAPAHLSPCPRRTSPRRKKRPPRAHPRTSPAHLRVPPPQPRSRLLQPHPMIRANRKTLSRSCRTKHRPSSQTRAHMQLSSR